MEKIVKAKDETFRVRSYQEKDINEVASLWEIAFEKEFPKENWEWKYHTGPFKNKILLCLDNQDRVKVLYGGIPFPAKCGGRKIEVTHLTDIMSHPDSRKTGLFIHTVNVFIEWMCGPEPGQSQLLYGFPGKYHFDIGNKYLDYQRIGEGISFLTATGDLGKSVPPSEPKICQMESGTDFEAIWHHCMGDYPFSIIRNTPFIRWRYLEHPEKKYEIWILKNTDYLTSPTGYIVLSFEKTHADIIDVLMPNNPVQIEAILHQIASMLADRGIKTLRVWLPTGHFLISAFLSGGFSIQPEPTGIIPTARSFDKALSFRWVSDHFYYTMGDGDLF